MGSPAAGPIRTVKPGRAFFRTSQRKGLRCADQPRQAPLPRPGGRLVLVFTVFPLVYSLYIRRLNVETKMQVKQDKVPVIDANGKQVISANGQPETRIQVTRQNVTTYKYNGFGNYVRLFHDFNVTAAIGSPSSS